MGANFVGHNVAVWRRRRGTTQRVLASLCGFSQAYVIAIETGEPGRALTLARSLDPRRSAAPSRRTAYHIDVGHALTRTRRDRAALGASLATERPAPQRVRLSPTVRDGVGTMVRRAHRAADTDLRARADRLGVT